MRNKLFTTALVSVLALLLVAGVGLAEVATPTITLEGPTRVKSGVAQNFITTINNDNGQEYDTLAVLVTITAITTGEQFGFAAEPSSGYFEFPSDWGGPRLADGIVEGITFVGPVAPTWRAASTAACTVYGCSGTYGMKVDLVEVVDHELGDVIDSAEIEFDLEPLTATWEKDPAQPGLAGVDDQTQRLYQPYELLDSASERIKLHEGADDNCVYWIWQLDPDPMKLPVTEGDTDHRLWFNVDKAAGDYVFEILTNAGNLYQATLTWTEPADASLTLGPGGTDTENNLYITYGPETPANIEYVFRRPIDSEFFDKLYSALIEDGKLQLSVDEDFGYVYYFYSDGEWYKKTLDEIDVPESLTVALSKPDPLPALLDPTVEKELVFTSNAVLGLTTAIISGVPAEYITIDKDSGQDVHINLDQMYRDGKLPGCLYNWNLTVTDAFGRTATEGVTFTISVADTQGPIARKLVAPEDGTWDGISPIIVEIEDDKSPVINAMCQLIDSAGNLVGHDVFSLEDLVGLDKRVQLGTTTNWNWLAELNEGVYELSVYAEDAMGNFRVTRFTDFKVEFAAPTLELSVVEGALRATATSASGLKSIKIQVNDEDPIVADLEGENAFYDFVLPTEAGAYEITVTVYDINDKSATDTYEYGVEGPELDVSIAGNQLSLAASSEVGLSRIEIRIDDEVVLDEALEGDEDSVAFELPTEVGEYRIKLTVWDSEGVPTVWEYTYIVAPDQEAPKIVSMDITEGILTVVVTDNQGLDKVVVYIDGVPYAEAEVSGLEDTAVFELPDDIGTKEVKADVYDLAGNNDCKSIIGRVRPDSRSGKSDGFGWEMWKN